MALTIVVVPRYCHGGDADPVERFVGNVIQQVGRVGHWLSALMIMQDLPWLGPGTSRYLRRREHRAAAWNI